LRFEPSNLPDFKQHFLKALTGTAWTKILAAELFVQFFFGSDDAEATFNLGFGGVAFAALTAALESRRVLRGFR
jgi:hypothetical protein